MYCFHLKKQSTLRDFNVSVSKASEGGSRDKEASVSGGYYSSGKPSSAKEKRTLQSVKTHFYIGTEVTRRNTLY